MAYDNPPVPGQGAVEGHTAKICANAGDFTVISVPATQTPAGSMRQVG